MYGLAAKNFPVNVQHYSRESRAAKPVSGHRHIMFSRGPRVLSVVSKYTKKQLGRMYSRWERFIVSENNWVGLIVDW